MIPVQSKDSLLSPTLHIFYIFFIIFIYLFLQISFAQFYTRKVRLYRPN